MRLDIHQLPAHLKRPLLPAYLVAGDEPLQRGEALDALRATAFKQGFLVREVLEADARFDWRGLAETAATQSLFGDRRVIELRLASPKIGTEGSDALCAYLARPPEDALLLVVSPKLERSQAGSKWVKELERAGALMQIWPVDAQRLADWLARRMQGRGLEPGPGVAQWLADRVEGNLLAAAQEVEKLLLLHGPGPVDLARMAASVGDSARFSVFDLADAALAGDAARGLRILDALQGEGTPDAVVLWALAKEIRLLAQLGAEAGGGRPVAQVLADHREIWDKRRALYAGALRRLPVPGWRSLLALCARADRAIKGQDPQPAWLLLQDLTLGLAGTPLPPVPAPH